mmetsp:Transcript_16549/g.40686  ORF Transcript_16549/g.40686 Transcript_16549/m.40686 type:complete len:243 (+) Transcript_16549:38-766(+)
MATSSQTLARRVSVLRGRRGASSGSEVEHLCTTPPPCAIVLPMRVHVHQVAACTRRPATRPAAPAPAVCQSSPSLHAGSGVGVGLACGGGAHQGTGRAQRAVQARPGPGEGRLRAGSPALLLRRLRSGRWCRGLRAAPVARHAACLPQGLRAPTPGHSLCLLLRAYSCLLPVTALGRAGSLLRFGGSLAFTAACALAAHLRVPGPGRWAAARHSRARSAREAEALISVYGDGRYIMLRVCII